VQRLERVFADLRTDRDSRDALTERLQGMQTNTKQVMVWLQEMKRCKVLEGNAAALYDLLKDLVRDNSGCVLHEVEYEHKDPSYRGRLFATGQQVKIINGKYPRTAT
jgi:predicted PhzF superfamily epimerase YddE/YHI9